MYARSASQTQRGISLIELIMFIVIVSASLAGILGVMNLVTRHSADPLVHKQALAIAESLLEEIELQDAVATAPNTPVTRGEPRLGLSHRQRLRRLQHERHHPDEWRRDSRLGELHRHCRGAACGAGRDPGGQRVVDHGDGDRSARHCHCGFRLQDGVQLMRTPYKQSGFTLVEMTMVIVITGIIGGMVAMFIRAPVQGYVDSARRAELTDIADTAFRRMGRDIRLALPNSVRVTGACDGTAGATCFIEFLPTSGGGRYRSGAGGTGNTLDFVTPAGDGSFEVIGPPPVVSAGDSIVVYNTTATGAGTTNAYNAGSQPCGGEWRARAISSP